MTAGSQSNDSNASSTAKSRTDNSADDAAAVDSTTRGTAPTGGAESTAESIEARQRKILDNDMESSSLGRALPDLPLPMRKTMNARGA